MFKCKYIERKCITAHILGKIVKLDMHVMLIKILKLCFYCFCHLKILLVLNFSLKLMRINYSIIDLLTINDINIR